MTAMREQLRYIQEVLGVQSWIRPSVRVQAPTHPALAFAKKESWSAEEKTLVEKILSALDLTGVPVETAETPALHVIAFDSGNEPRRMQQDHQIIWQTCPLQKLIEGTPPEIQQAKREVWNILKRLKEEIRV